MILRPRDGWKMAWLDSDLTVLVPVSVNIFVWRSGLKLLQFVQVYDRFKFFS
jgi:hypothetical protein